MQMLNTNLNGLAIADASITTSSDENFTDGGSSIVSCWDYWQDHYYPTIIRDSYPVYLQDRAKDSGKQAFEIIKVLQDKKLMKLEKVSDFIEAMDTLIKVL